MAMSLKRLLAITSIVAFLMACTVWQSTLR